MLRKFEVSRVAVLVALAVLAAFSGWAGCSMDRTTPDAEPTHADSSVVVDRGDVARVEEGPAFGGGNPGLPGLGEVDSELVARLDAALVAKGTKYQPRTHHLEPGGSPTYTNRLILETSPYLLQHAHNPVNWYAWDDEAFERARREDKPVLLSVGYSTCHWCHVMERESFEDEEIARYLNENYIAIKVDREERPDVDDLYMKAVQMLTGRGGWPMTVVMTADKEPFFGGTYFPARDGDRGARTGFLTILRELRAAYDSRRGEVVAHAQELSQRIKEASTPGPPGDLPQAPAIEQVVRQASASFDSTWGGFGPAPKFPRPALLELLLRYHRRTGHAKTLHMVEHTLERMAAGGIYDHVGGGFHRYATDERWLVPHFEKMLYDNAQLVPIYLGAYQITGRERFAEIARETLAYVSREMTAPGGGFFSATDADSKGPSGHDEEGYFFSWTPSEVERVIGARDARVVSAFFGITDAGNFEGRNVLTRPRPDQEVAASLGISVTSLRQTIEAAREQLHDARSRRPPLHRDDKILTAWNGLMISAFARAALVLGDEEDVRRAERAADFVLRELRREDGRLLRSFGSGRASHDGYLDDYAFLVQGLLDLYEASSDPSRLEQGIALQEMLDRHFWDAAAGGYFMTGDDHEKLLARDKPTYDGAEPSGNSVALVNLLRLAAITTNHEYRRRAERGFAAFSHQLTRSPYAHPKMLSALECYLDRPLEVFVVRPSEDADVEPLISRFRKTYLPNRVFTVATEGSELADLSRLMPALEGKQALGGRVTAFVCERGLCKLPTSQPEVFARQLGRVEPLHPGDAKAPD